MLDLELLRFHDKLSFLLSELIEDGVCGSSGSSGGGDCLAGFVDLGARGPVGFFCGGLSSADVVSIAIVWLAASSAFKFASIDPEAQATRVIAPLDLGTSPDSRLLESSD